MTAPSLDGADAVVPAGGHEADIGTFLAALAAVQRETVVRFETTVNRITAIITAEYGKPCRDLVIAFQDFDRLQQELSALGGALHHVAAVPGPVALAGAPSRGQECSVFDEAIAAISIAELKERLHRRMRGATLPGAGTSGVADEAVF